MSSFQKKQSKPLCKVCKDAGKCESEYLSHFVKSDPGPKGVVVCPTLLAYTCTYCRKPGHSVGYCLVLKTKNKEVTRLGAKRKYDNTWSTAPNKNKKALSKFMALVDSSDDEVDEEVEEIVIKEAFPALSTPRRTFPKSCVNAVTDDKPVPVVAPVKVVVEQKKRRWADWSDSDDE